MNNPIISILCITYNHRPYITYALDGFLKQKLDYSYEIIVHDDASSDGTADVIREYANNYPNVMRPIYQTVNQYSRGINIIEDIIFPLVKGKYVAFCEGDDYWIDPYKLQKQVSYLESNPECSAVTAAAIKIDLRFKGKKSTVQPFRHNCILNNEDIIMSLGSTIATASIVFRAKYTCNLPLFFTIAPVRDYPLLVHLALLGKIYYFSAFMSVYRAYVPGSFSEKYSSLDALELHREQMITMVTELDKYTDGKYHYVIKEKVDTYRFFNMLDHECFQQAKLSYPTLYQKLGVKQRIKNLFKKTMPAVYHRMKPIMDKYRMHC